MTKILILLLLTTSFVFGQEVKYHSPSTDLENSQSYYLFGDNVKFRKSPNTKSEVLELLKIGTEVQVLKQTVNTLIYNGIESPFYQVKFNNQIGYILGGLLSLEKKESNNFQFLFSFKRENENYSLITRMVNEKKQITEVITPLNTTYFSIDIQNNKGIKEIDNILFINYLAEACGVDGGGIYYFQSKNKLKKVLEIAQISEAGLFWVSEELIFPEDEDGVKGKIVYKKEIGNYKDDRTNWVEVNTTSRELEWKDGDFFPKPKPEN